MCLAFPSADDWQWLQQDPPPAQGGRGWSGRTGLGNRWGRQELCLTVEEEALLFIMSRRTYQTRKNRHTTATAASSRTFFYLWEFSGRFSGLSCFKTKTLEGKTGGNDCHWSMTKQTEHLENKNMCRAMLLKNICRDFNPHPSITKNRQLLARLPEFCRMSMEAQTWQEIPLWPSIPAELELVSLNLITQ